MLPRPDQRQPGADLLDPGTVLELDGWQEVARRGGRCLLTWRADWLAAQRAGLRPLVALPPLDKDIVGPWSRILVNARRARLATLARIAEACPRLSVDGRLLLRGSNRRGIAATLRQVHKLLGTSLAIDVRGHGRAAIFAPPAVMPDLPRVDPIQLPEPWDDLCLCSAPGLFAAGRLDRGSAVLLRVLANYQQVPRRVLDLGSGVGVLACAALARWPAASALACEGEAEALACLQANAVKLSQHERLQGLWWDAQEPLPKDAEDADLVLCNPPCHDGDAHSLMAARSMITAGAAALRPGGRLLLVANQQLPYQRELEKWGPVQICLQTEGFKVLELLRAA